MTDAAYIATTDAEPEFRDYFALLKPRVMSLSIFTAAAAMVAAPVPVHPVIAIAAIICIAVGAGASGALNMWWDADIDAQMARTRNRPAASGKVTPGEALARSDWRVASDDDVQALLVRGIDSGNQDGFPLYYMDVTRSGSDWAWTGEGDCQPQAVFRKPRALGGY